MPLYGENALEEAVFLSHYRLFNEWKHLEVPHHRQLVTEYCMLNKLLDFTAYFTLLFKG
jgi:hypothetical protein